MQSRKFNLQAKPGKACLFAIMVGVTLATPVTILAQRGSNNRGDRSSTERRERRDSSSGGERERNSGGNRDSSVNRNPSVNRGGRDRDSGGYRNPNGERGSVNRDTNVPRSPNTNRDWSENRIPGGSRDPITNREGRTREDRPFGGMRDRNPGVNRDPVTSRDPVTNRNPFGDRDSNGNRESGSNRESNATRDSLGNRNPSLNRGERYRDSNVNRESSENRDSNGNRNPNANRDAGNRNPFGNRGGQERRDGSDRGERDRLPNVNRYPGGNRDAGGYRNPGGRDGLRNRNSDVQRAFTRSVEGRRFNNGVTLRRGNYFTDRRWDTYFPQRYCYYPYYAPARSVSLEVVLSPFYFYYGVTPSYIHRTHVVYVQPRQVYVEVPVYVNNEYRGYRDSEDDYYLYRRNDNRWRNDPELTQTVDDLVDAFRDEDIALLTELTDPNTKIAIFSKGRYEYSLEPGDYLDMTRDFMYAAETDSFNIERVVYKTSGVYQVFAKHTYRNRDGENRMVYLCFVVENLSGRWAITQVDTSPDRIEN